MKVRLSYSSISTFLRCRKAYWFAYVEGLVPKEKPFPMQVGDIVHRLMHMRYKGELSPELLEGLGDFVQQLYPDQEVDVSREVAAEALTLFKGYIDNYTPDPVTIIASEVVCEVDLGPCILSGTVDAICEWNGELWRHEYKTTSRLDSMYLSGLRSGLQGAIYDYLTQRLLQKPLAGTIYDLIVKTRIPTYHRSPVRTNPVNIRLMLETVEGVCRSIERGDFYPSSNCYNFAGECVYRPLCVNDSPDIRTAFYKEVKT